MTKLIYNILIVISIGLLYSCQNNNIDNKQHLPQKKWENVFNNEGQFVINEFMSKNDDFLTDETGTSHGWIELYNGTKDTLSLNDYYLSNDEKKLQKWQFPKGLSIAPDSFIVVFASGKNSSSTNELHCNFTIGDTGQPLILVKNKEIVHCIKGIAIKKNQSYGLIPDGGNQKYVLNSPSPNKTNLNSHNDVVLFSHEGGIYNDTFSLTLKSLKLTSKIYYTLDGNDVDTNSFCYEQPIQLADSIKGLPQLSATTMTPPTHEVTIQTPVRRVYSIKAAPFDANGKKIGPTTTFSYFIESLNNVHRELPILSINIPPHQLIDTVNGLFVPGIHWKESDPEWSGNYYQKGKKWEREAFIEYYHPKLKDNLHQVVGIRVHGGNNRRYSQKALRIYARAKYGIPFLNYKFISQRPHQRYKQIVLRPFRASWTGAGFENKLSNDLAQGLNVESTPTDPLIIYINGEYWGIYFIEERLNHHYFKLNFDIDRKDLELIGNWRALKKNGSNTHFNTLFDFVLNNDLSINENYKQVSKWMDIDNFIDYQILQQFIANYDWPANNMKCWRDKKNNTKWRWAFFDGDGAFGGAYFNSYKHAIGENNKAWSADEKSTLFFKKLMENEDFKNAFLNRSRKLFNNHFTYKRTQYFFDSTVHSISPDIRFQQLRHDYPESYEKWKDTTKSIDEFLQQRVEQLSSMIGL